MSRLPLNRPVTSQTDRVFLRFNLGNRFVIVASSEDGESLSEISVYFGGGHKARF